MIDEGAGETVSVTGSTVANDTVDATEVTITDNDAAPTKIVLTVDPGSVAESANPTAANVTVTATVTGGTVYATAKAVTVVVDSGTAVEGTDFASVADFAITIPAGASSATGKFKLDPTEDVIDEGAGETVSVTGSTVANDTVDATEVTITDNDAAPTKIVLTVDPGSVAESANPTADNVTVTATVTGGTVYAAAKAVTVVVDSGTAVEGTDFASVADFAITIPAGASSATGKFKLDPVEDVIDEGAGETVSVTGSTVANDTVDATEVTITDNDAAPTKIVLTVDPGSVAESANPTADNVTVTATVAGGTVYATAKAVTVVVDSGTAVEGTDFASVADFAITIPAGASSATGKFKLDPVEDVIDEGAGETVSVTGSTVANDTVDATEVTITDNDAAPTKIVLTVDPGSVAESANPTADNVTVTATVTGGTVYAAAKAVTVVVDSGTAVEGTDFASVADFAITIPAGASSATGKFKLDPTEDVIDEGAGETVSVTGSTVAKDTVDATEVTITDNDGAPTGITLTVDPVSVPEGANATTVTVTATVNGSTAWATPKVVTVVVDSGTAVEGTDFETVTDFMIEIQAGTLSAAGTFTLDPVEDVIDEGAGETVAVSGTTPDSDAVTGATVTIDDNDDAPTKIVLTVNPGSVAEGADPTVDNVTVTATVTGGTVYAAAKEVKVAVGSGTAVEGTDFETVADFTIEIPAGRASATGSFELDPVQDVIDEGTGETVSVTGSTVANDTVDATEVTITDDDGAPTGITLTVDPVSVAESANPGAPNVTVTATVTGGTTWATPKVVTVVVGSGTAVEGTDFENVADFDITIPAGASSATRKFTLDPTEDVIDEGAGETVAVSGSTPTSDTVDATAVTIADNDGAPTGITLTVDPVSVSEGANATTVTVTATVNGGSAYAENKVVTVAVGSGTAVEGTDFEAVADFDITIPAGTLSATGSFTLDPTEDVIDEGAGETVAVSGETAASDTVDATAVTIADNDGAPTGITLTVDPVSVSEGANATTVTVTATVNGGSAYAENKVVTVAVGSGTAVEGTDFEAVADFDIAIPAGTLSATGSFTLDPVEDVIDEGAGETVAVSGSTPTSDTVDATTVTIADNDGAPTGIALTVDPVSVPEEANATTVTVTATVNGGSAYAENKVVTVVVGSGTAVEGTDFANVADFDIAIPAGTLSATGKFTLDPVEDVIDEGAGETVAVSGTTSDSDAVTGATVTIADNDGAPTKIVLTALPGSVVESANPGAPNVTVTATVTGGTTWAAAKVVTVAVGSGTAVEGTDFASVADFAITIPAGKASAAGTFTLDPTDDAIDEGAGETVAVSGSTADGDPVDATEVTITDNDGAPTGITLTVDPVSVPEGANATTVTVTAAVNGGSAYAAAKTVTVAVSSGTAVEGTDFASVADFAITIPAGKASAAGTFTLDPTDDAIDEGAGETVAVTGSTPGGDPVDGTAVTIADDDTAAMTGAATATVNENEAAVGAYGVTGAPPAETLVWSLAGVDAAAFEIDGNGALAFRAAPDFEKSADADDNNIYQVTVKTATDGGRALASLAVAVTVADVAEPPPAPNAPTVTEVSNVSLAVAWTAPVVPAGTPPVTGYKLQYREAGSTGAWTPHGHGDASVGTTIEGLDPATSYKVQVMAFNHEGDSPWSASGTGATGRAVSVSIADARAKEGETITFEVTLSSDAGANVVLNWTTVDGTAKVSGDPMIPGDYEAGADTLTIAAGATTGTIAVRTVHDIMAEDDETFTVVLSAPAAGLPDGVTLTDAEATGTIEDDDEAPREIVLIATDAKGDVMREIPEGGGEKTVTVKAEVKGGSTFPEKRFVRVRVEGSGDDGVVEFTVSLEQFDIEIPAGHVSASRNFVLKPEDDAENEEDETVEISGEMVPEAGGRARRAAAPPPISVVSAQLVLVDDDNLAITGPRDVEVDEGETHVGAYSVEDATVAWSLAGVDAGAFEIDGNGTLAFRIAPDFEAATDDGNDDNVYDVTVRAAVGGASAALPVTVTVVDVNEPPVFEQDSYAFELEENRDGREEPVALGTVTATDAGDTLTYAISGGDTDLFTIDAASGMLSYIGPGEDFESEPNSYGLTVTATDGVGLSATAPVTVEIVDVNEPPVFKRDSYEFELEENRIGPVELDALTAADPDAGDTVAYGISAGGEGLFAIDAASGMLSYTGPGEDYESEPNVYDLTVNATDGEGLSAEAGVTVTVTDEEIATARARLRRVNEAILPELLRTIVSGVVESVVDRVEKARSGMAGGGRVAIAGRSVAAADEEALEALRPWDERDRWQETSEAGTMDWKEALRGTSFTLALGGGNNDAPGNGEGGSPGGPGAVTVWGGGDWRALSGGSGESPVEWDGDVVGARLGVDARLRDDLLVGLALDWSRGSFDWTDRGEAGYREMEGTHESEMTSLHPYMGWWPNDRTSLWASLGHGRGEVRIEDDEAGRQTADAALSTAGAGGRMPLFSGDDAIPGGTASLALRGEAWVSWFEVEDNGDRMAGLTVDTNRLRLGLEGAYECRLAGGGSLTPSLEAGLRHDGGDGETGLGVELGGGLVWNDPVLGLTVEGRGRALVMHGGDIGEWGAGGSVLLDPGAGGLGLSLELRPSWGDAAEGGVDRLWQDGPDSPFQRAAANDDAPAGAGRLEAEIGYGLPAFDGHGVLTPYGGLSLSDGGSRSWRVGGRLAIGPSLTLGLEGERYESANDRPHHSVMLKATAWW